ncbi:MAG TPA: hypothetical protein DEP47_03140, partial [Chloroflexi bacterium]|nr:hypothetical protein [Chloroflexota bacterium]
PMRVNKAGRLSPAGFLSTCFMVVWPALVAVMDPAWNLDPTDFCDSRMATVIILLLGWFISSTP